VPSALRAVSGPPNPNENALAALDIGARLITPAGACLRAVTNQLSGLHAGAVTLACKRATSKGHELLRKRFILSQDDCLSRRGRQIQVVDYRQDAHR